MKWARRYRARLRSTVRTALLVWRWYKYTSGDSELLVATLGVSKRLLDSDSPSVPRLVGDQLGEMGEHITRVRMGFNA